MKQEQKRKKRRSIWRVIGSIAFLTGMCAVMPKLIEKGSDYLYSRNLPSIRPQDDDDWGPEIVRRDVHEER